MSSKQEVGKISSRWMDTTRWIRRGGAIEKLPSGRMQEKCHRKYLIVPSKRFSMAFLGVYWVKWPLCGARESCLIFKANPSAQANA